MFCARLRVKRMSAYEQPSRFASPSAAVDHSRYFGSRTGGLRLLLRSRTCARTPSAERRRRAPLRSATGGTCDGCEMSYNRVIDWSHRLGRIPNRCQDRRSASGIVYACIKACAAAKPPGFLPCLRKFTLSAEYRSDDVIYLSCRLFEHVADRNGRVENSRSDSAVYQRAPAAAAATTRPKGTRRKAPATRRIASDAARRRRRAK